MMDKKLPALLEENTSIHYEIRILGHLEAHWSDWLGGLEIMPEGDNSLLTGTVPDQAALHGILVQIRDLGLTLISITPKNMPDEESEKVTEMLNEFRDDVQYAGFARRLKAFAFDYIIIFGYILLLAVVTMAVIKVSGLLDLYLRWPENPILADLMAFVTLVLPVILYFTLQESSSKQSTWGKRKARIRVVNADGGALTQWQAFIRSLVKVIPWQIAHTSLFHVPGWPLTVTTFPTAAVTGFILVYVLVGIYIAAVFISKKHRTPYDWASGSYVIVEE